MDFKNQTLLTEFVLLGFSKSLKVNIALFIFFLGLYLISVHGNSFILCAVFFSPKLHTPMYFFICTLAMLDLLITIVVVPKMLSDLISAQKISSVFGCILQCFIILYLSGTESLLLALMAYDRYMAICSPLTYPVHMRWSICYGLTALVWIMSFMIFLLPSFATPLALCNPNLVNHFMCEILAVIQLACDSINMSKVIMQITCFIALLLPFMFIITSYICIISTVLNMHSAGRSKAFSTCTSHITVVALAYGTAIIMYFGPSTQYSMHQGKYFSLFSYVICPTLNPIIYGLNNKEVKETHRKITQNIFSSRSLS